MKQILSLALLAISLFIACTQENGIDTPRAEPREEHKIIDAVLDDQYNQLDFFHILEKAGESNSRPYEDNVLRLMVNDTTRFDEFVSVDTISQLWDNGFRNEVTLFSEGEVEELFETGFWISYYDRYEDSPGYLVFGKPFQISPDRERVFIVNEMYCGSLCGYGFLAVLEKINGRWVVESNKLLWIS